MRDHLASARTFRHWLSGILLFCFAVNLSQAGDPISYQELTQLAQPPPVAPIYYGTEALQFGELRLPHQHADDAALPVVILLHGGCWFSEYDISHVRPLAQAITDLGYATWTLEYRRIGDAGGAWPGTFADVADGVDFLRPLAPRYHLDLNRVLAMGHSAGGQLALWLASREQYTATDLLYRPQALRLSGVIGLAAAADLDRLAAGGECDAAAQQLMQSLPSQAPQRYQAVSPQRRVPLGLAQILINGANDRVWSPIADSYFASAQNAGDPIQRWVVPEAAHFDLVAPQEPAWPYLIRAMEELFKPAIEKNED